MSNVAPKPKLGKDGLALVIGILSAGALVGYFVGHLLGIGLFWSLLIGAIFAPLGLLLVVIIVFIIFGYTMQKEG